MQPEPNISISADIEEIERLKQKLKEITSKYRNKKRKTTRSRTKSTKIKKTNEKSKLLKDIGKYVEGLPYVFIKMQMKDGKFSPWKQEEKS